MAERTHPHAEATYRVIPFDDGTFGVEVSIPDSYPTTVSKFATGFDAEAWIAQHQRGQLLPPLNLPALAVSPRSSLYADLTRHAGILATFRLAAESRDDVLAVFQQILDVPSLAPRRDLLCAE